MHIHFEIMLCLCKGLSLLDEGTQGFENTHNTAEQLEESLLICMYIKPHKSFGFGYHTKTQPWFANHKYTAAASQ